MCWVSQATRFQKGKFQKKLWCRVVGGREGGRGLTKYLVIVLIGHCKRGSKVDVSSVSPLSERKDDGRSKSQLKKKLFTVANLHYQLS